MVLADFMNFLSFLFKSSSVFATPVYVAAKQGKYSRKAVVIPLFPYH